jgi:hypothetical protein
MLYIPERLSQTTDDALLITELLGKTSDTNSFETSYRESNLSEEAKILLLEVLRKKYVSEPETIPMLDLLKIVYGSQREAEYDFRMLKLTNCDNSTAEDWEAVYLLTETDEEKIAVLTFKLRHYLFANDTGKIEETATLLKSLRVKNATS